jgi:sentrin-specific protease 1
MPEVTSMMNNVIFSAGRAAPGGPVVEAYNSAIWRKEIDLLQDIGCLNNEVITFYMQMIGERSERRDEWPTEYVFNTFFFGKLLSNGHRGVKRWTSKVDIFSYKLVFIPLHIGLHWCRAAVDFNRRKVSYYDSLGSSNSTCLDLICLYLEEEHADKKGLRYDPHGFSKVRWFLEFFVVAI